MHDSLCRRLDWDSEFFGFEIARLSVSRVDDRCVKEAFTWCTQHGTRCLYFLADAADMTTLSIAGTNAFRLVDIRITLDRPIEDQRVPTPSVREARDDDVGELRNIARESHRGTRFYNDPGFPSARCDEFYSTWIERSCRGYADLVFVAEQDGAIQGYITCHRREPQVGVIGLVAVRESFRRLGFGRQLIEASFRYFLENSIRTIEVVTQGNNIASQRLYQACGFRTKSVELWFHRWFS